MNPLRLAVALVALVAVIVIFALAYASVSSNPQQSNSLVLTAASSGHTFTMAVGQTVQIQLQDAWTVPGSSLVWNVTASDSNVLATLSVPKPPSPHFGGTTPVTFSFRAHSSGFSILNALGSTTCEAMAKASCPDQQFSVTILVRPNLG